jgi:hypothetical protein
MVHGTKRSGLVYWSLGTFNPWIRNLSQTPKNRKKMIDIIPLMGIVVTILFTIAFYLGLQEIKKID